MVNSPDYKPFNVLKVNFNRFKYIDNFDLFIKLLYYDRNKRLEAYVHF